MAIKFIKLSCMIDGEDLDGNPCKSVETQMSDYLKENKDHTYVDFKYKSSNSPNMECVTLIVNDLTYN